MTFKCPKDELTTYVKETEYGKMKVQLVTKLYYDDVEDLLDTFDINACRFAYNGNWVYASREAMRGAKKMEVTLNRVTHPNATFKRILKYRDKGYKVTNQAIDFFTQSVYDMGMNETALQKQFYVD